MLLQVVIEHVHIYAVETEPDPYTSSTLTHGGKLTNSLPEAVIMKQPRQRRNTNARSGFRRNSGQMRKEVQGAYRRGVKTGTSDQHDHLRGSREDRLGSTELDPRGM